jgi:hypothetical protein
MKSIKLGFVFLILMLAASCTITSPVMLEAQVTKSTSNALPYTVGVAKITKKGSQQLTKIKTYQTLALVQVGGRMPRRSEVDYYNKAFVNALRSNSLFNYVYATPYDQNDVDLVIDIEIENFNISNSSYGTIMSHATFVPVVGIFASLGMLINVVPQEYFSGGWAISYHLKNKNGKLIKTYKDKQSFTDFVRMWEQPFGSYSWYESAWIKLFNSSLNRIQAEIRKDSQLIRNNLN